MVWIKYQIAKEQKFGEETYLVFSDIMKQKTPETLEIAKREAYNGEYTIEDDGQPEPEPTEQEQLRADVDFLLAMGGVL